MADQTAWQAVLAQQAITDPRHVRLVTEGALFGTVVERGAAPDLAILSDDAGQFDVLTHALKRMRRNPEELLRVLQRPELPLHNNLSESDIRDHVKKRKISGSTRSESGRRCRDTFASLKKTCRKNRLSFWQYVQDRVFGWYRIAPLAQWVFEATRMAERLPVHGP